MRLLQCCKIILLHTEVLIKTESAILSPLCVCFFIFTAAGVMSSGDRKIRISGLLR